MSTPGLSSCFDANTLWLPATHAWFATLPDTRPGAAGLIAIGVATEYLHRPVNLHVSSPELGGREVRTLNDALDVSYFVAFGLLPALELTLASSVRSYQRGAGSGGVTSQSSDPLAPSAVRSPRVGLGYSLDRALASPGIGLRIGLEATLPLERSDAFAGERSPVVMPSSTFALQLGSLRAAAMVGARFRQALELGGVRLGNQGYLGVGIGYAFARELLSFSIEAFALPSLTGSRAATANARVTDARLLPAEWLASLHSSFGTAAWTVRLGAGGGLPLSSETRSDAGGTSESHFLGLATPDFRSLLMLHYEAPTGP